MTHDELMQERRLDAIAGIQLRGGTEGDGLTLEGIAVPFGTEYAITDRLSEVIDPDCDFGDRTVKVSREHGDLIGRITGMSREADGLHVTARLSDTAPGRDAAQLVREGVLDAFSIGFRPVTNTIEETDGRTIVHRRAVELYEVAVTGIPAYPSAAITGQRTLTTPDTDSKETPDMDPAITDRLDAYDDELRSLKNTMAHMAHPAEAAQVGAAYRTGGDYLKALAAGDADAADLMRQTRDLITSSNGSDTVTWIADQLRLIEQRRKVMGLLTHDALPPKGMSMEYHVVTSDTMSVAKQAAEGDGLTFGKVGFGTRTAEINTYGGYTSLSRQAVERATVPVLNTALRALSNAYARATELAVRAYLYELIASVRDAASGANKIDAPALASMKPNDWASLILDAAETVDERNTSLGTLAVSSDVAKHIISLTDTGSRFLDISGKGGDELGSFDLTGVVGQLMRVPVHILPEAAEGTAVFLDPEAVTVWESGGPTQLTDSDSIKLTESYSVYGYLAIGATNPDALLPIKFATK